jgi:hypothetical protein
MTITDSINLFMPMQQQRQPNLLQSFGLPPEELQLFRMFGLDQMLLGSSTNSGSDFGQMSTLFSFLGLAMSLLGNQNDTVASQPAQKCRRTWDDENNSYNRTSTTTSSDTTSTSGTTTSQQTSTTSTTDTATTGPKESIFENGKITLSQSLWDSLRQDPSEANRKKVIEQAIFKATGTTNKRVAVGKLFNVTIPQGKNKDRESGILFDDIVACIAKRIDTSNLSNCPSAMSIDEGYVCSSKTKDNRAGRITSISGRKTPSGSTPSSSTETPPPAGSAEERAKTVAKMGSPLTLDLNGDGVKTSTRSIQYDIDGDGALDGINDISNGDGMLVIDTDGDGVSGESGHELLGDNTDLDGDGNKDGFKDGFDALRALAERAKQSGIINNDDVLDATELQTLGNAYGLKIKTGSLNTQAVSLNQAGVTSINLSTGEKTRIQNFDGQGNDTVKQNGALFTRTDGSQGTYEDIFFQCA